VRLQGRITRTLGRRKKGKRKITKGGPELSVVDAKLGRAGKWKLIKKGKEKRSLSAARPEEGIANHSTRRRVRAAFMEDQIRRSGGQNQDCPVVWSKVTSHVTGILKSNLHWELFPLRGLGRAMIPARPRDTPIKGRCLRRACILCLIIRVKTELHFPPQV